jgi:hypothetical protein
MYWNFVAIDGVIKNQLHSVNFWSSWATVGFWGRDQLHGVKWPIGNVKAIFRNFSWMDWAKPRKTTDRAESVPSVIQNEDLLNESPECWRYENLVGCIYQNRVLRTSPSVLVFAIISTLDALFVWRKPFPPPPISFLAEPIETHAEFMSNVYFKY